MLRAGLQFVSGEALGQETGSLNYGEHVDPRSGRPGARSDLIDRGLAGGRGIHREQNVHASTIARFGARAQRLSWALRRWDQARALRASFTRSAVSGIWRRRTPVASKMALPMAAAITVIDVSPAPVASSSGRFISTHSIFGI